jgi:predicted transcriptional regulator
MKMERKNRADYLALRESGKSLQEIADIYGVSKQRVHEVLSEKSRTHKRTELRQQVKDLQAEVERLNKIIESGRKFLRESVVPLKELAMDISLKYEPCGYYCDPDAWGGGHHDHKLFNQAKYLFGSGLEDYLPIELDPFPEDRADQQTERF